MLYSRLYLLVFVITAISKSSGDTSAIPSACDLNICSCPQLKLICSCPKSGRSLLELKQDGYGFIPDWIAKISVENCQNVIVFTNSINKVRSLRQFRLANIRELTLHEKSFSWKHNDYNERERQTGSTPGINIEIVNSTINKIPNSAFEGHIDQIFIETSTIHNIEAFSFSSLDEMEVLKIKDCTIDNFEQHSFKKFIINHFAIEGGKIGVMNSYTIRDVIVKRDLRIQGVNFGVVKSLAVTVDGPSAFRLEECLFELIESEAFKIYTKGPVFINDNIVRDLRMGAFMGITVDTAYHNHNDKQELVFENNTFTKLNNAPIMFNTTGLKPRIERLVLNVKCSCKDIKDWQTKLVKYQGQQTVTPDVSKQTWCYDGNKEMTVSQYNDKKCKMNRTTLYVIIGLSVSGLLLIAACLGGFIFYKKYKRMSKAVKDTRDKVNENRFSTYSNTSNHIIVLPQSKTYLETEIDCCNEEVQPLKVSQSELSNLKETGL